MYRVLKKIVLFENWLQLESRFYIEFPLPLVVKSGQPIAVSTVHNATLRWAATVADRSARRSGRVQKNDKM